jgi:hypothetical protein
MTKRSPALRPDPAYVEAFAKIMARIEKALGRRLAEPVIAFVAGGAAVHFYTGARFSEDIDAAVSARFIPPSDLAVAYRAGDGKLRTLYFDTQYNESFALLHENAHEDAIALPLKGVNPARLQVKLLCPLDLAVSKLARFEESDRRDIGELAKAGLIDAKSLRRRADGALPGYVGAVARVQTSIDVACRLIGTARGRRPE